MEYDGDGAQETVLLKRQPPVLTPTTERVLPIIPSEYVPHWGEIITAVQRATYPEETKSIARDVGLQPLDVRQLVLNPRFLQKSKGMQVVVRGYGTLDAERRPILPKEPYEVEGRGIWHTTWETVRRLDLPFDKVVSFSPFAATKINDPHSRDTDRYVVAILEGMNLSTHAGADRNIVSVHAHIWDVGTPRRREAVVAGTPAAGTKSLQRLR